MTQDHPITPPPELVEQLESAVDMHQISFSQAITRAYVAGADQELEACREWVDYHCSKDTSLDLCAARRPKPPSLKQQALDVLQHAEEGWQPIPDDWDIIRRALEALPDG